METGTEQVDLSVEQDGDSDLIRKLRKTIRDQGKQLRAKDDSIAELNKSVRSTVMEKAGVPEKARNALTRLADDVDDFDWSEQSLKQLAEDNGFALSSGGDGGEGGGESAPPADDVSRQRQQQQERRQAAMSAGTPPPAGPPDLDAQIAAALEAKDFRRATELRQIKVNKAAHRDGLFDAQTG